MTIHDQIRSAVLADQALRDLAFIGADNAVSAQITVTEPVATIRSDDVIDVLGLSRATAVLSDLREKANRRSNQKDKEIAELVRRLDSGGVSVEVFNAEASVLSANEKSKVSQKARKSTADEVSEALLPWRPNGKAHQLVTGE